MICLTKKKKESRLQQFDVDTQLTYNHRKKRGRKRSSIIISDQGSFLLSSSSSFFCIIEKKEQIEEITRRSVIIRQIEFRTHQKLMYPFRVYIRFVTHRCKCMCERHYQSIEKKTKRISLYLTFGHNRRLLLLFFFFTLLSLSIERARQTGNHTYVHEHFFFLLSLVSNPNAPAAIIDSVIYPSFFFFFFINELFCSF